MCVRAPREELPRIETEGVVLEPTERNVKTALANIPSSAGSSVFEVKTSNEDLLVWRIMSVKEGIRQHIDMIYAFDRQGAFVALDGVPDEVYKAVPCPFWETQEGEPVRCGIGQADLNWRATAEHAGRGAQEAGRAH